MTDTTASTSPLTSVWVISNNDEVLIERVFATEAAAIAAGDLAEHQSRYEHPVTVEADMAEIEQDYAELAPVGPFGGTITDPAGAGPAVWAAYDIDGEDRLFASGELLQQYLTLAGDGIAFVIGYSIES